MRMTSARCRPRITRRAPATRWNQISSSLKAEPSAPSRAPRATKTTLKPKTNARA